MIVDPRPSDRKAYYCGFCRPVLWKSRISLF
jgi:hypothetical protein